MYFSYSPQRSNTTRIDYLFEPSKKRIIITYRTGSEITKKNSGIYEVKFNEITSEEYILNLQSESYDFSEWPFTPLTEFKVVGSNPYLTLLKPYGPEEENDLAIRYPGLNKVDGDCSEKSMALKTSLNDFQQFSLLWMDQLSEIKCQIYNLLCYLSEEYKKIDSGYPPFPSPISIRALKTSIFQDVILYIEATANFLASMVICVNDLLCGAPQSKTSLEQCDIDKLTEANGKYIRLEDKLVFSIDCLNRLLYGNIKIDKGDCNWGRFKDFKKRRDSITHVKIPNHIDHVAPTLDHMVASVFITDSDISHSIELLCWFNALLNDAAKLVGNDKFPSHHDFNDYIVGLLVVISFSIENVPSRKVLQKYNIENF